MPKAAKDIIVRVQSPDHGTRRLDIKSTDPVSALIDKVQKEFDLGDIGWRLHKNHDASGALCYSRSKSVDGQGIKHGDMLYLVPESRNLEPSESSDMTDGPTPGTSSLAPVGTSGSSASVSASPLVNRKVVEDEVDRLLSKQDGKIPRPKNEQLCRHGPSGKCLHCVPLEPYDESYLKSCDPPIKFLSFHSYIKKLTGGVDRGKFATLENLSCKIKPGCREHPPWPDGICTKCQPNAVTLNRQKFRHIDNIMFENASIVDRFLNYWRSSGNQRIGILYGRYEPYTEVPLGIKANVCTIYEPPQLCSKNRVELLVDEKESTVRELATRLGLSAVGWIFTDLLPEDRKTGSVKHFRGNLNSHFLSAEECIVAADFQNKYPNPCRLSPDGHFGSKFVTVVVTGDENNQIHFDGYQVSDQGMALVKDEILIPTHDAPELGYVKESTNEQYVPDVFYKHKDEYGNEVTQLARPLPLEYLFVDMATAFSMEPQYTFPMGETTKPFPKENRTEINEIQDFNALMQYMEQFPPTRFMEAMSNFHLLVFLATSDMLPLKDRMSILLDGVKDKDESKVHKFKKTEEWATVEEMIAAHIPSPTASRQSSYAGGAASSLPVMGGAHWTCSRCTYLNPPGINACEVCSQAKDAT